MTKKVNTPTSEENSIFSDEDWKLLLPGRGIKLGSKTITLLPLDITGLAHAITQITSIHSIFKEAGINEKNFQTPEKITEITRIILAHVPDLLAEASGIPVSDLKRLPFDKSLEVLNLVLDANLESIEGLEKNLPSLVAKIAKLGVATKRVQ